MESNNNQQKGCNPLQELLVEAVEVDRAHLVKVLKDYIRINCKDGKIILQDKFSHLCIRDKVLAFLLGRKVALMLEYKQSDAVSKDEIKFSTGIMRGILTPILIELKTEELISRAKSEGYFVSDDQMLYVLKELEKSTRKSNYLKNRLES